jgi:hypothetical protein
MDVAPPLSLPVNSVKMCIVTGFFHEKTKNKLKTPLTYHLHQEHIIICCCSNINAIIIIYTLPPAKTTVPFSKDLIKWPVFYVSKEEKNIRRKSGEISIFFFSMYLKKLF